MVKQKQVPLFDSTSVKKALDRLRQARPLGNNPLRRLIWLRQQAEDHGPHVSPAGFELALWDALIAIIEQRHSELRTLEQLASSPDNKRVDAINLLRADFAANNDELRAWSILYHRYVRIDLNLQFQEIASLLNMDPRQIRRHTTHGFRRLTAHLSHLEVEARATNWQLWLSSKMPPSSYATIFGMEQDLEKLLAVIESATPPPTIIVTGPGGIGKTTLVRLAAQRLIDQQIFQDLAWLTLAPPTTYHTVLAMLADDLGYYHLAQAEPSQIEGSLRVRLENIPAVVILDNADSLENYDSLFLRLNSLIGSGRVLAIMRPQPAQGIPVHVFHVPPMSEADLISLIQETTQLRSADQNDREQIAQIRQIARAVGGNPLAAKTAASQLAFLPLDRVLRGLSHFQTPEGDVLFERLYGSLWAALTREAQQVAIALSLLTDDSANWITLQQITEMPAHILDSALGDLGTTSFIDSLGPKSEYSMPPLARTFVIEQANRAEWEDVYRQLLAATIAQKQDIQTDLDAYRDNEPGDAASLITLMQRQTAVSVSPEEVGSTALTVADQVRRAGLWAAWRNVLRYAMNGLDNVPINRPETADIFLELGIAARWLGDFKEAISSFETGLMGFHTQNRPERESQTLIEMGQLYETLGQTDPAFSAYEESLRIAGRHGLSLQRRRALNGLAGLVLNNDRPVQALELLEEAVTVEEDEPPDGQTLSLLGSAYLANGNVQAALDAQQKAIDWFLEHEDYPRLARAHMRMGMALHSDGQTEVAFQNLQQGLHLMKEMADAFGQARILTNMGVLYASHQHWQDALVTWKFALTLQEQLDDRVGGATTLYNIADLEWNLDRHTEAQQHFDTARTLAEQLSLILLLEKIRTHPLANS